MNVRILCASAAALLAIGVGANAALAQGSNDETYQQQSSDYQQQQQDYQQQRDSYERAQDRYHNQSEIYAARRDAYLRDRDAYDARYGSGAFIAYYRDHPGEYDQRYGFGAYERDFGAPAAYESR